MFDPIALMLPLPVYLVIVLVSASVFVWGNARVHLPRILRVLLPMLAVWAWLLTTPGIANLVVVGLEGPSGAASGMALERDDGALLVVLASGSMSSRDGKPRPRLDASGWERLHAGIRLWRGTGGTLLFTGGPPGDAEQTLANQMRIAAIEAGVPPGRIVISPGSRTTYEDLAQAQVQIRQWRGANVWLVTSAMHMPRALGVAEKLQLPMRPFRCDYRQIKAPTWRAWLPDNGGPMLWYDALHETVGRQYYRLRNWSE